MSEFAAVLELSSLDGTNGIQINGESTDDFSGRSVASAGDVNGDGFDDLIIGAMFFFADAYAGASYVVFGKAAELSAELELSALDGTNGFRINGAGEVFSGRSVASAGDFNGDGVDDLIIGNWNGDAPSYVVFGEYTGFSSELETSSLDGTNGFQILGEGGASVYTTVAGAGDINGDGFDDLIISTAFPNGNWSAVSYVVFGGATASPELELSALDGTNGFQLNGDATISFTGLSVASAGDVNGDGFDDLIIGSFEFGPCYVMFGRAAGFSAELELSTLDGTSGFQIDGVYGRTSVASAGDVNGDGFDDLMVGEPVSSSNGNLSGTSYVVFGHANDFSAEFELSSLDGANGFQIKGAQAEEYSGCSVASAGDVNGDGFDDLIIGASRASPNGGYSGASYVVFGKASGFSAALELSALDGTNGFRINGEAAYDYSGWSVASAGDLNGDGFDDLTVGSPEADPNGAYSGASYVIFGRAPDAAVNRVGSAADQAIHGGGFNDTIDGRGGADTLSGGEGDDGLNGSTGADTLSGGDGDDVLNGSKGTDVMIGGLGEDLYYLDRAGDTVVEQEGEGVDVVRTTADYALADHLENLFGRGGGALSLTGNGLDNRIIGADGADTLSGLDGADWLKGGEGEDILTGGNGGDTLRGGAGSDIFDYNAIDESGVGNGDVISDFTAGDRIDLSDFSTTQIAFLGSAKFSGAGGAEVRVVERANYQIVYVDADGDGHTDMILRVSGQGITGEADFIL